MGRKEALGARRLALPLAFVAILLATTPDADAQLTSNVFRRVLMIRAGDSVGTAFTIDVDGRQYLLTAKHVVASLKAEDTIGIRKGDDWISTRVTAFRCHDPIDIAVLIPPNKLTVSFPLEPTMAGIRYGQDVYFVGFPYGVLFTEGKNINGFYPVAFVKKGVMSASTVENGVVVIFLDGHNNPGFSGGPIVYRDFDRSDFVYKLAGVVSGYRPELTPVLCPKEIKPNEDLSKVESWRVVKLPDGRRLRLEDTDHLVATNTGIVVGYSIEHAVDLIRKHPVGPKITD
jgi:hypothetical protein